MNKILLILMPLFTGCIVPRAAEDRCLHAGLDIKTMSIAEDKSGKQKVKVECENTKDIE